MSCVATVKQKRLCKNFLMSSMAHHTNLLTYYKWSKKKMYVSMISSMCGNFSPVSPFLTINTAFERGDLPLSSSISHYISLCTYPVHTTCRST
jgi:hypothetical protein